ncbi:MULTISPECIES: hypothetical protein [Streptomyces]|uniref:Integral membrane protein n=1 Tax=Streptomyces griseiscabiei TaxID=2993540 RepID=A0ABU4LK01_9ACTN|nr:MULTISPECIES: hypothetical protein [Streptomyces]MBP5866101.1 hypothetical protein [Streptomyces sp. LBUM 1484]MBP5880761.1 hypothetical protein [Streptomyces sp. LBUM 1477]MBZ3908841.1 hypothetical protein [Streptomyces griseiscabiei]MDX2567524.1 hypothetical protein [Streptomyces scabiei]MDX2916116.1 hypothetical protein [Streptomyces griseiscabiei]
MHDDQQNSTRPAFGPRMSDEEAAKVAQEIIAGALREEGRVPTTTRFHDPTPVPTVGNAAPVAQKDGGRPPMSQAATDISGVMLAGSVASVPIGGVTCLVLYTLGHVDTVNLAIGAGAPVAFLLAVGAVLRRLAGVRTEHHHHYDGPVVQDHSVTNTTTTKGLIARTRNDLQR